MLPKIKIPFLFVLALWFLNLGTLYIVKEGGKEVGRYTEDDGKSDVIDVAANAPVHPPAKTESKKKSSSSDIWAARRGPDAPGSPERLAKEAQNLTPEQAIKKALDIKAKAEAKAAETQKAIDEMQYEGLSKEEIEKIKKQEKKEEERAKAEALAGR